MSLALAAYRAATGLAEPVAPLLLRRRASRGKEDPARLDERLGHASADRPAGPLVWVHGASVGETLSALPLVERIGRERPGVTVLVTSGTRASADLLRPRLPPFAVHQYVPIDAPGAAARFLDHWRPDLLVLLESELWPNLLLQAKARGCRLALVSARITDHSAEGWSRLKGAARRLLSGFDLILTQDDLSAQRLETLGATVQGRANLKLVGSPLEHDRGEFERLSSAMGDRAVVVSASTHTGEEALAPDVDVYLADTLGELGLFFRLADVVVLGGGWTEGVGGHNPLEPARLGKATVSGPSVGNWRGVFAGMVEADAVRLAEPSQLAEVVGDLLAHPDEASALGERGRAFARREDGALDRLWAQLRPLVPA